MTYEEIFIYLIATPFLIYVVGQIFLKAREDSKRGKL